MGLAVLRLMSYRVTIITATRATNNVYLRDPPCLIALEPAPSYCHKRSSTRRCDCPSHFVRLVVPKCPPLDYYVGFIIPVDIELLRYDINEIREGGSSDKSGHTMKYACGTE